MRGWCLCGHAGAVAGLEHGACLAGTTARDPPGRPPIGAPERNGRRRQATATEGGRRAASGWGETAGEIVRHLLSFLRVPLSELRTLDHRSGALVRGQNGLSAASRRLPIPASEGRKNGTSWPDSGVSCLSRSG